jgi:hypothetical protein
MVYIYCCKHFVSVNCKTNSFITKIGIDLNVIKMTFKIVVLFSGGSCGYEECITASCWWWSHQASGWRRLGEAQLGRQRRSRSVVSGGGRVGPGKGGVRGRLSRAAHWQRHAALGAGRQSGDGGWQQGPGVDRAMAGSSRGGGQAMVGGSKGGGQGSASGVGGGGAGHGRARPKERQRWIGRRGR